MKEKSAFNFGKSFYFLISSLIYPLVWRKEYQWFKQVEEEMIEAAKCNGKTSQHETVFNLIFLSASFFYF